MKKIFYAFATVVAMTAISCSKEADIQTNQKHDPQEVAEKPATLTAQVGDITKVSADNAGVYKWQTSDKITIQTNNGNTRTFTAAEAGLATDFSGSIPETDELDGGYAFYPASDEHAALDSDVSFHIPSELTWSSDASNMPMFSRLTTENEKTNASFHVVGGALKLVCFNIPTGATKLAFTAKSMKICGDFEFDADSETPWCVGKGSDSDKEIITVFSDNYSSNKVFYIPLPVVTLTGGFTITIYNDNLDELFSVTSTKALAVTANKLIIAPALNCAAETVIWKETFTGYSSISSNSSSPTSIHTGEGYNAVGDSNITYVLGSNSSVQTSGTMYSGGASSPELLVKSSYPFTVSNIPAGGNTSLELSWYSNRTTLSVTASTADVTVGSITHNGSKHTVTLSIKNSPSTFNLTFSASENTRFDDVVLAIPAEEFSVPTIASDDEELAIGVGETSASTNVALTNAVDGLGISFVLDGTNADKFTAAIEDGTLTVTAKEASNTSGADYTATLTLKATGAGAKAITLSQANALVPNPTDLKALAGDASATITFSKNANASSYLAYLHSAATETPATGGTNVTSSLSLDEEKGIYSLELTELTNDQEYYIYVKVNGVEENYVAPSSYVNVPFTPAEALTLSSIAVTTNPTKMVYSTGESFSMDGAVVTATYSDKSTANVTSSCTNNAPATFESYGPQTITISYTEGVEKTCELTVYVWVLDVLNPTFVGKPSSYTEWSGKEGVSGAVYAGNSTGSDNYIQIRSSNSSGIVTTASGGNVRTVSVVWNSSTTQTRYVDVYGKTSAYSSAADLYSSSAETKGTLLGTITYDSETASNTTTSITIADDYDFIGLRSRSNALYLDEIIIGWEPVVWDLKSIAVKTAPTKVTYEAGEHFNPAGLVITATYSDHAGVKTDKTVDVAYSNATAEAFTFTPSTSTALSVDDDDVSIAWGGKSTTQAITVNAVYSVTFAAPSNGSLTVLRGETPLTSGNAVPVGATINVTATPNSGYALSTLVYNDGSDHDIKATKTFTMPAHAVSVSATFAAVPTISMNTTSIAGVAAAGVTTTVSSAYNLLNGASNNDVTITCDGTVVTAASKNATAGTIDYTVADNTGAARNGWIKVQYSSEDPHQITVSQLAGATATTLDDPVVDITVINATTFTGTWTNDAHASDYDWYISTKTSFDAAVSDYLFKGTTSTDGCSFSSNTYTVTKTGSFTSGTSYYFYVLAKGDGSTYSDSENAGKKAKGFIIIDGSQLTSTATTGSTNKTYSGVTVNFSAGAKTQSASTATNKFTDNAILIGKSGANIHNTTALPGIIEKFELFANKGASAKVSVGLNFSSLVISSYSSSAANKWSETLSNLDYVYNCTGIGTGSKYFFYQVTNAYNSQVEFRITYVVSDN